MASSLLALLDDITTVLDDVALLTKVAAKKTTGVLADDLALNAQQVSGVNADRELPVVWAVALGSLRNKAILVPAALLISALAPWAVIPLLMLGGAFLCFEGFEKLAHRMLHGPEESAAHEQALMQALVDPAVDLLALEREKIKGAIRTDFILSAEIITITLGTVATSPFTTQVSVLTGIAILMTIGVYGFVAMIVKLDDAGLWLYRRDGDSLGARLSRSVGKGILSLAPVLMKGLSVVGTAAMFLVGGGILSHGLPALHHGIEALAKSVSQVPLAGGLLEALTSLVLDAGVGLAAGAITLGVITLVQKLRGNAAGGSSSA